MRRRVNQTMRLAAVSLMSALVALAFPGPAHAGCGCDKPPPPRAAVRPFVGWPNQMITLFDSRLVPGEFYSVQFRGADGTSDWSRGKAALKRDLADGQYRAQLRVSVGAVSLGPCQINVYAPSNGASLNGAQAFLYALPDDQFTVTAPPITLRDIDETMSQDGYQAGVGRDGSVYLAVDVSGVSAATTFTGTGLGFPLAFGSSNVAMYNDQGFLMQLLDPNVPGLFQISAGDELTSNTLAYWRHEFATYKTAHRQVDAYNTDNEPNWHADGTRHVNHDLIVVAIRGKLADGTTPVPGATPPFQLVVTSTPAP